MRKQRDGDGGGARFGPRRARLAALAVAAVVLAAMALLLLRGRGNLVPDLLAPEEAAPDSAAAPAGTRAVVLVFADAAGTGWVTEERQLPAADHLEDELRAALEALCQGPLSREASAVIPPSTRPLAVFYDEKQGAVLVDFSRELAADHPGGAAAEKATVDAILRTIALNFPQVRRCAFLVGGVQLETLAGHVGLDKPFDPRRWL